MTTPISDTPISTRTKLCPKCAVLQSIKGFQKNSRIKDGLQAWCRSCRKEYDHKNRPITRERDRENQRRWRAKNPKKFYSFVRANRRRNPIKDKCWNTFHAALRNGTLIKRPCIKCGDVNSEGHHADHAKPLDVVWLCRLHHRELHNKQRTENGI